MADEGEFQAPAGGFITAGSKKAVTPSAAPFDPFADDGAPAAPKPASGALFQTAGARRPVRPKAAPAAPARKAPKAAFDPFILPLLSTHMGLTFLSYGLEKAFGEGDPEDDGGFRL